MQISMPAIYLIIGDLQNFKNINDISFDQRLFQK